MSVGRPEQAYLIDCFKKTGFWSDSNTIWWLSGDIQAFWLRACDSAPELGAIAIRLLSTPATGVPSERSFSGLNMMMSKARNRLRSDRVDKLQYVYHNERLLNKIPFIPAFEEDKLDLENGLISMEALEAIYIGTNGLEFANLDAPTEATNM
jgi:hypothetical protein